MLKMVVGEHLYNELSLLNGRTRTNVVKRNALVGTEFSGSTQHNIFQLRCCQQSYHPCEITICFY